MRVGHLPVDDLGETHLCELHCPVKHVMHAPTVYSDADATVRDLLVVMAAEKVSSVVVQNADLVPAIVTEHDIVEALGHGKRPEDLWAGNVATTGLVNLRPDSTLADAARVMADHHIHHVPVEENGRIVGMVSAGDVILALTRFEA